MQRFQLSDGLVVFHHLQGEVAPDEVVPVEVIGENLFVVGGQRDVGVGVGEEVVVDRPWV